MEKNYFQILQVDSNDSSEIIDKAYKTLIKKYHPDLQTEENKAYATEMIKKLNEAYEVLSNYEKRKLYDANLNKNNISKENYNQTSKKPSEEKFLDMIALFITIIIVVLLFKIPFIKNLFFNMISIK